MLRIKTYKLLASFLAFLSIAVLPNVALADVQGQLQNGVNAAAGGAPSCTISESGGGTHAGSAGECGKQSVDHTIALVVNIISSLVGVIAVIMLVVAGFRYVTSGGDSNRTASAKNTIIYALVGILVVAFAQVIVHFVLAQVT
jgi:hypothetical protein